MILRGDQIRKWSTHEKLSVILLFKLNTNGFTNQIQKSKRFVLHERIRFQTKAIHNDLVYYLIIWNTWNTWIGRQFLATSLESNVNKSEIMMVTRLDKKGVNGKWTQIVNWDGFWGCNWVGFWRPTGLHTQGPASAVGWTGSLVDSFAFSQAHRYRAGLQQQQAVPNIMPRKKAIGRPSRGIMELVLKDIQSESWSCPTGFVSLRWKEEMPRMGERW